MSIFSPAPMPTVEEVKANDGYIFCKERDVVYTTSHCTTCNQDFVLESPNDPAYETPRHLEFDDMCDDCL